MAHWQPNKLDNLNCYKQQKSSSNLWVLYSFMRFDGLGNDVKNFSEP